MAAYSWNIMWLDCIVIFPLIMLALEHLVKEGKGMAYCLLLGFSILSNYYISIMTCMFLVFYMIALLILEQEMTLEKFVGRLFQFAGYSLWREVCRRLCFCRRFLPCSQRHREVRRFHRPSRSIFRSLICLRAILEMSRRRSG